MFVYKLCFKPEDILFNQTFLYDLKFHTSAKDSGENLFICAEEFLLFSLILESRKGCAGIKMQCAHLLLQIIAHMEIEAEDNNHPPSS